MGETYGALSGLEADGVRFQSSRLLLRTSITLSPHEPLDLLDRNYLTKNSERLLALGSLVVSELHPCQLRGHLGYLGTQSEPTTFEGSKLPAASIRTPAAVGPDAKTY